MPPLIAIACTACKTPLATMYGERLYVGACVFDRTTPLICLQCGRKRVWTPPAVAPECVP